MRVKRGKIASYTELQNIPVSAALVFKYPPHQSHNQDDVFMKMSVTGSYVPDAVHFTRKEPIVNLRTGALAWVQKDRECWLVDAEVHVEDCT